MKQPTNPITPTNQMFDRVLSDFSYLVPSLTWASRVRRIQFIKMLSFLLLSMMVFSSLVDISTTIRNPHEYFVKNKGHTTFKLKYGSGECKSDKLTCVPQDDCDLECPYGFRKLKSGGACYYYSEHASPNRTFADAEDYCEDISARLLWIEDAKELQEIIGLHMEISNEKEPDSKSVATTIEESSTIDSTTISESLSTVAPQTRKLYFIAAEYDKDHESWLWKGTHDEIDWNILLFQTPNVEESLKAIEDANVNKCLVLNLPKSILPVSGSHVKESECIDDNGYICKMGQARARCAKTTTTVCCFSPSYDFYVQNGELGYADLHLRPGGCQMDLGNIRRHCEEVLSTLKPRINETNMYSISRIGSSYYYVANTTDECVGREAIILDEKVHSFVTSLFATKEVFYHDKNVKIGLTFRLKDRMAYWADGKLVEYYNQYWYPGEPKRDESVDGGCAAYSNVPGTATYLWRLFSKEMCEDFNKVCELPLSKGSSRVEEKEECGKRHERGVLAKTIHSVYSTNEANFGEFPWQAAIMYLEKYGREVRRKFACSGALIHKQFVLTSAHCLTTVNVRNDFVVVLGQHDLGDEDYTLEPLVMDVKEVIIHNDFNARRSFLDDLALLQLDGEVDVNSYPHIGLGCLPDPDDIKSRGDWECFVTGWSAERKYGSKSKVLQRIDADFTSEEYCRYINRKYYESLAYSNRRHYSQNYNHHNYRSDDAELLCTYSNYGVCLDDPSPILICKKATTYVEKPFFGSSHSYGFKPAYSKKPNYKENSKGFQVDYDPEIKYGESSTYKETGKKYFEEDEYIVNAYGGDRFNSDKWFVIGIGNTLSECGDFSYDGDHRHKYGYDHGYDRYDNLYSYVSRRYSKSSKGYKLQPRKFYYRNDKTEVFTSVYDYIDFIYYILDLHQ